MSVFINDLRRMGATDSLIDALCFEYGGTMVYVGKESTQKKRKRNEWIKEQYKLGISVDKISLRTRLTIRRIKSIVSEVPQLFPEEKI
jgi:Mor family transcriptional regulator